MTITYVINGVYLPYPSCIPCLPTVGMEVTPFFQDYKYKVVQVANDEIHLEPINKPAILQYLQMIKSKK